MGVFVQGVGADSQGVGADRRSGHSRGRSISGSSLVTGRFTDPWPASGRPHGGVFAMSPVYLRGVTVRLMVRRWSAVSGGRRTREPRSSRSSCRRPRDPPTKCVGEQADLCRPRRVGHLDDQPLAIETDRLDVVGDGIADDLAPPPEHTAHRLRLAGRAPCRRASTATPSIESDSDSGSSSPCSCHAGVPAHGSMIAPSAIRMTRSGFAAGGSSPAVVMTIWPAGSRPNRALAR